MPRPTDREAAWLRRRVLKLLARGRTASAISAICGISTRHVRRIKARWRAEYESMRGRDWPSHGDE